MTEPPANDNGRASANTAMIRLALGLTAFISAATGLIVYLFAGTFGLEQETAMFISLILLAVGLGDYLLVVFWDRLAATFGRAR